MVEGPGGVSFVGRSSLSRSVLYRRFHCIILQVNYVYTSRVELLHGYALPMDRQPGGW